MSSLLSKLKKNSKIDETDILSESKFFDQSEQVSTDVPMINVALSGKIDGGLSPGLTVLAGPSKHFKTSFGLLIASSYLKAYEDSVILFYDSEFGSPQSYFLSFGIDPNRVLHTPIGDVEKLKFDLINQLEIIEKNEKVIIVIDSIGNLASKKELEDTINEKSVADMSRAKSLKGLFRMVTPYLTMKSIPLIAINHTYDSMGLFPTKVVSGGCLAADTLIQTPEGLRPIQDFLENDLVITQYGNQKVSHTWTPETLEEGYPECYEIEFEDGYKVTCSPDHKFIIDGKWVCAKDIVSGMDCATIV
jgi:hypothetical protein